MRTKSLVAVVAAAVMMVVVAIVLVGMQAAREQEAARKDPMAVWVCDTCGYETRAPWNCVSADCPRCAEGQMVQRVFFRCRRCGKVFEGYQMNWSPMAPRAADRRTEADAHKPLAPECEMDPFLVRRPDGPWVWGECSGADDITHDLSCPRCGKGRRDEFDKLLVPPLL